MTTRKAPKVQSSGDVLGLKLLQSVREMNARNFSRVTKIEVNDVVQARQSTGLSQGCD